MKQNNLLLFLIVTALAVLALWPVRKPYMRKTGSPSTLTDNLNHWTAGNQGHSGAWLLVHNVELLRSEQASAISESMPEMGEARSEHRDDMRKPRSGADHLRL